MKDNRLYNFLQNMFGYNFDFETTTLLNNGKQGIRFKEELKGSFEIGDTVLYLCNSSNLEPYFTKNNFYYAKIVNVEISTYNNVYSSLPTVLFQLDSNTNNSAKRNVSAMIEDIWNPQRLNKLIKYIASKYKEE